MKIDKKIIKELSDYLDEFNLTELEYTEKDTKIKVSKNNISINNQTNQTLSKEISSNKNLENQNNISGIEVTSPIIGTAYHAPEPGAKKFVEVGKKIKKDSQKANIAYKLNRTECIKYLKLIQNRNYKAMQNFFNKKREPLLYMSSLVNFIVNRIK